MTLAARHRPSARPIGLALPGTAFADYIADCRGRIAGLHEPPPAEVVAGRLPFEMAPAGAATRPGVLLIHGLFDSAFVMRDIAAGLARAGHRARGLLLPGHGTQPGDLLAVDHRDWIRATAYGVESFADQAANGLVIVGFSTGATLALHHLLTAAGGPPIRAVVLLSPGIRARSRTTPATCLLRHLGRLHPRAAWLTVAADADAYKYESFAFNAACQFHRLTRALARSLAKVASPLPVPVFMAVSADDLTIDAARARRFFTEHAPAGSRLIWYTTRPEPSGDPRIEERQSADPAAGILDFAHVSLPNAPANPHYGAAGRYRNRLHDPAAAGRADGDVLRGEVSAANRARAGATGRLLLRLTYNTDFDGLMTALGDFLDRLA